MRSRGEEGRCGVANCEANCARACKIFACLLFDDDMEDTSTSRY